ncbi:MAG: pyruvate carboxylase subunit B, partial [Dehalococcoidia bacterium]
VAHRFLNEDPWERVRILKRLMPKTPLLMLLRAQNLVGYRNYPDDVVRAFVQQAAEVGIDIFRVFDALNDERNMEACFATIKECGKHIQATVCYSITEARLGGPVYNLDYYVNKALVLQDMGADSLCIKDMAGLLGPYDAYDLVKALKTKIKLPIQLHTHYTSGMASMSTLKAIEAGIDVVDTSLAPFALRSSHPSSEAMVAALKDTGREPQLDMSRAPAIGRHLEAVFPKYHDFLDTSKMAIVDTQVLSHQVPGGMISNLVAQLREAEALDRLGEVHEELARVRADLGYPPLVTPTSQIVGTQAVQNVLFGRYKTISTQVKDYIYGLYGRPPAPVDPQLIKLALKDYPRGRKPITGRPADLLEDELGKAEKDTKGLARNIQDVLIYALFPITGMRFLKWKYGMEEPPPEVRAKTLEEVEKENELIKQAKEGKLAPKLAAKGPRLRSFNVWVGGENFQVDVEPLSETPGPVQRVEPVAAKVAPPPPPPPVKKAEPKAPKAQAPLVGTPEAPPPEAAPVEGGTSIVAPMPGIVIRYEVEVGQEVKAGQSVVIIETMKMENSLPSPVDGKVSALPCRPGQSVGRGEVLAVIG